MQHELIPHLFRKEFSRIVAVLSRQFGMEQIDLAEDIASDTFLSAMESWPYKGLPDNPSAWLYTVAKNKAKNYWHRSQLFDQKIAPSLKNQESVFSIEDIDLSEANIRDSQLQMLFAICHPRISKESQIALALRILCGFGIDEIAHAFLTNKETIHKRIVRAKEKLRSENVKIEFPEPKGLSARLDAVLATLYLLFNEGYYSETNSEILREELCQEAMRLTQCLLDNTATNQPSVNALFALTCFHSSRFTARKGDRGEIILYDEQDEKLWDKALVNEGMYHLKTASSGSHLSRYHIEAAIAFWHTQKIDNKEKWEQILHLYDQLLLIAYSPVAALNRAYALSKVYSNELAIEAAEKLQLLDYPYYHSLLGTLYTDLSKESAIASFQQAIALTKNISEKKLLQKKLDRLPMH